eukprot:m.27907 g.27907  ORF g.27907 m.27907 type:complete len:833 (+) comp5992_c0_seq2:140-2638(+)
MEDVNKDIGLSFKALSRQVELKWSEKIQSEGCMRVHLAVPSIGVSKEYQNKILNRLMKMDLSLSRHHGVNISFSASGDLSIADLVMGSSTINSILFHAADAHVFIAMPGATHTPENVDAQDVSVDMAWAAQEKGNHSIVDLQCEAQQLHGKRVCVMGMFVSKQEIEACEKTKELVKRWDCDKLLNSATERCIAFQGIYDSENEESVDGVIASFIKNLVRTVGKPIPTRLLSDTFLNKGEPLPPQNAWESIQYASSSNKITFVSGYGTKKLLLQFKLKVKNAVLYHDFGVSASHAHFRTALINLVNQTNAKISPLELATKSDENLLSTFLLAIKSRAEKSASSNILIIMNEVHHIADNGPLQFVNDTVASQFEWIGWRKMPHNVRFVFGLCQKESKGVSKFVDAAKEADAAGFVSVDDMKHEIVKATFASLAHRLPHRLSHVAEKVREKLISCDVGLEVAAKCIELVSLDAEVEDTEFLGMVDKLDDVSVGATLFAYSWGVFHDAAELLQDTIGNNFLQRALQLIAATETGLGLFDIIRLFRIADVEPIYLTCVAHILRPFTRVVKGRLCFDIGIFGSYALNQLGDGNAEGVAISQLFLNQWKSGNQTPFPALRVILERPHMIFFGVDAKKKAIDLFEDAAYIALAFPRNELKLDHANLGEKNVGVLATIVEKNATAFKRINLYNNNLDVSCTQKLVMSLSSKCLSSLNLSRNPLSDAGVKVLFSFIKSSALLRLFIRHVAMTSTGAKYIADALPSSPFLTHLNISDNDIGNEGFAMLCKSLFSNQALQSLGLRATNLSDTSANGIISLLEGNKNIILDIRDNNFSKRTLSSF